MVGGITTLDPSLRWDDLIKGDAFKPVIPAQAGIQGTLNNN
jgi:hypothetical protein